MVRVHKTENEKPVSSIFKEPSGSEKKKRKLQVEAEDKKLREQSMKFFCQKKPASDNVPQNEMDQDEVDQHDLGNDTNQTTANEEEMLDETYLESSTPAEPLNENSVPTVAEKEGNHDKISEVIPMDVNDPATWPNPMPQSVRESVLTNKVNSQSYAGGSGCAFQFFRKYFSATKSNGEYYDREWLRISNVSGSASCVACCFFSPLKESNWSWSNYGKGKIGYSNFNNSKAGIEMHEESRSHRNSVTSWKIYLKERESKLLLPDQFSSKMAENIREFRIVLKSMLDAIMYLAQNNLAFRGVSDNVADMNCGNYLSLIKLLAKYSPPLAIHLERLKFKSPSYLSPSIQNEFISLCGYEIKQRIFKKIRMAKYFSILFDATPDSSRTDQLSQVIRYLDKTETGYVIRESFIDFISTSSKTGEDLTAVIIKKLEEDELNIPDCRGQGYDNGSNMSGPYRGVQAQILQDYPYAQFIPCAAHSLNRVEVNAAEKVLEAKLVLGQITHIYAFFAASTDRWKVLRTYCKITLKGESSTRWSSKANAVNSLWSQYLEVMDALSHIVNSNEFNGETIVAAKVRFSEMLTFKFLLGLCIWSSILTQINKRNLLLQQKDVHASVAEKELEILCDWLRKFRNDGFDSSLKICEDLCEKYSIEKESGFSNVRKGKGINPKYDDPEVVAKVRGQSNLERFESEFFNELMDKLIDEMTSRFHQIRRVTLQSGFLWGTGLAELTVEEKEKYAKDLCMAYPDDLSAVGLVSEIQTFRESVYALMDASSKAINKLEPLDVLNILAKNGLELIYPNCEIALRIYLTLPVTVASNERCFSKLKLIKNYLRSSMGQERLCGLAIISIEKEESNQVDYDNVIDKFAAQKCRRFKDIY